MLVELVARPHCIFIWQLNTFKLNLKINVNSINISTVNMKNSNLQFSLGKILSSLHEIFNSRFHGKHCQKKKILCVVKVFHGV